MKELFITIMINFTSFTCTQLVLMLLESMMFPYVAVCASTLIT